MRTARLGNEIIDLNKLTRSELMRLKNRRDFFCTHCHKPVIFKNGTRKRAHFSHEKKGIFTTNPESSAHILVKHAMVKWLKKQGVNAEVEKRFPSIDRIADVYFENENARFALEIQKSPMSDIEFNQRRLDYHSIGMTVIWIFLGEIGENNTKFQLPPVMIGRETERLLHFCVKNAQLHIFENPIFLTTRDIYAQPLRGKLNQFTIKDLTDKKGESMHFDTEWLEIKKQFRKRGWFYASKSEKKLLEQCLIRGFNLSLLPTEIGWPVSGNGIRKSLFVWQAYVLIILMKYFNPTATFLLQDIMSLMMSEYQVANTQSAQKQVLAYLKWLAMFGIVTTDKASFKYIKNPKIVTTMEQGLERDRKFVEVVEKLWKQ